MRAPPPARRGAHRDEHHCRGRECDETRNTSKVPLSAQETFTVGFSDSRVLAAAQPTVVACERGPVTTRGGAGSAAGGPRSMQGASVYGVYMHLSACMQLDFKDSLMLAQACVCSHTLMCSKMIESPGQRASVNTGLRAVRPMSAAPGDASRPTAQLGKPRSASASSGGIRPASALTGRSSEDAPLRRERMQSSAGYASPSGPPQIFVQDAAKRAVGARSMPRPASALGATTGRVEIGRSRPGSAFARPKRPVSALGNLGRPDADKDGIDAQGRHGVDSTNSEDAHAVHKDSGSFVAGDKMRPDSVGRNWRRPASALSRLPRASLKMPLHPMEQLGRGMGSDIGIDPSTQQLLADRQLARKSDALIHKLHARNAAPDPFLEELRKEMQQEEKAQQQEDADNASDDNHEEPASRGKRVRQITDLRPAEMARLQGCFKDDRGLHAGLPRTDFERVMREFTGMEGKLGCYLFALAVPLLV